MADNFPMELWRPATIAVMGLPYTFRQKMGNYIAKWAKCPNSKFEVILNALLYANDQGAVALHSPSDAAFHILCETALSLLDEDEDQSHCVVTNFPTPTNPQLQKLVIGLQPDQGRLLIIECQRRNHFRWRRDVEIPDQDIANLNPRYDTGNREPGKWEDVEKAILNHRQQCLDEYFLTLLAEGVDVKKLVVDPFEDLRSRDFTHSKGLDQRSLFAKAIKSYLACDDDEYEDLPPNLDYISWRRQWLEHQASSSRSESNWCGSGDCIIRFANRLDVEPICDACEEKVAEEEGAYYCQFCSLSLHQSCALVVSPTPLSSLTPTQRSHIFFYYAHSWANIFPGRHACDPCEEKGKRFIKDREFCDGCVFRTHLKCKLLPTVVKHSCDQPHFLSIRLSWGDWKQTVFDCKACGLRGNFTSYSCNICNTEYHLPCVLDMPLETNQVAHGGHTHTLNVNFSCGQRELDEFEWCPICYDDIDPDTWVYTCQSCDFIAHLYCVFPSYLYDDYKKITQPSFL